MVDNLFPVFSNISLDNEESITAFVNKFESYSDFNFTSLLCWDVAEDTEISWLDKNLIIKLPHYLTGESVYSVLGDNNVQLTVETLVERYRKLELVPQPVIDQLEDTSKFGIEEDRDNFDYMYNLSELCELPGGSYKVQRNKINQFNRVYPGYTVKAYHITSGADFSTHRRVFLEWALEREVGHSDVSMESKALDRFMRAAEHLKLIAVEIMYRGKLIGFSINEIVGDGTVALCHFQKALHVYKHSDSVLTHHTSLALKDEGCVYINWEQDLGIAGLRQIKQSYKPIKYLKKYTIIAK